MLLLLGQLAIQDCLYGMRHMQRKRGQRKVVKAQYICPLIDCPCASQLSSCWDLGLGL